MRFLGLVLALVCLSSVPSQAGEEPAYWLWAGHNVQAVPESSVLYIYQGNIRATDKGVTFHSKGMHPFPLRNRQIFLVFRLYGAFPDAHDVVKLYKNLATRWEQHGPKVLGLQIDFDAATSKLGPYADYLEVLRRTLPDDKKLSITGLGDWTSLENPAQLKRLTNIADEVVFQMYQGKTAFPDKSTYIRALEKTGIPFKLGLLANDNPAYIQTGLEKSRGFNGLILFPDAAP